MQSTSLDLVRSIITESIRVKTLLLEDQGLMEQIGAVAAAAEAALRRGNKLLLAGNGGSAADSQHIAAEFVSRFEFNRPALSAIALTTDTSMLTAIGNDYGFEQLFARQLEATGRQGDVFIGISTSGSSRNILKAVETAAGLGITTVALCGNRGSLGAMCDHVLAVPSSMTARIQECHILIGHTICSLVERAMFGHLRRDEVTS